MDVDDLSFDSDFEENSAPYHIGSDVWMVPCTVDSKTHTFVPMVQPSAASLEHRQERQAWQAWEDELLRGIIEAEGAKHWTSIAKELNDKAHNSMAVRHGKQCRERWYNHLDPALKKGNWTHEEDLFLLEKQQELGNHWSEISKLLIGRNENSVKNRFKSLLRKAQKELPEGTDPIRWLIAEKRNQEMEITEGNSINLISPMITSASLEGKSPMQSGFFESGEGFTSLPSRAIDTVKRGLRGMEHPQDLMWQRGNFRDVRDSPLSPSSFLA
jgi:hypothetical protein